MSNLSSGETTFNKSNDLCNNVLTESGLKYKITFHQEKYISKVTNNAQKEKRKTTMLFWCFKKYWYKILHRTP